VTAFLELLDWRRRISEVYAAVRAEPDPQAGHALWRARRDELFRLCLPDVFLDGPERPRPAPPPQAARKAWTQRFVRPHRSSR